jgi:hypothetical protein
MISKLHIFHPGCEISLTNSVPNFHLPKLIRQFELDLEMLPLVTAMPDDAVLVAQNPSDFFLEYLSKIGFKSLKFISFNDIIKSSDSYLLEPWCKSPYLYEKLAKIPENILLRDTPDFNLIFQMQSKANSASFCKYLINKEPEYFIPIEKTAKILHTLEEIITYINLEHHVVLKAPVSSSGRGNLIIRDGKIANYHIAWINSFLDKQKIIVAEPLWNKKMDVAAEFFFHENEISFVGFSFFETNSNGFYKSNFLNFSQKNFQKLFPNIDLQKWVELLKSEFPNHPIYKNHRGFLGVDAMVIEKKNMECILHPFVEVNARYTMGLIACYLEKYIHQSSVGKFLIYANEKKSFKSFSSEMSISFPMEIKEKKAYKGFFPLSEPKETSVFGAYMLLS